MYGAHKRIKHWMVDEGEGDNDDVCKILVPRLVSDDLYSISWYFCYDKCLKVK